MTQYSLNPSPARHLRVCGLFCVFLMSLLMGCGSNLSGEPEIITTIAPTNAPQPHAISSPIIQAGETIFANRCTRCHGTNGEGDGELVLSGQIANPGNFTQSIATDGQSLQDWFNVITNGNLANGMPPWEEELTTEERWALALYTYTLSYTADQIANGEALVTSNPTLNTLIQPFISDQSALINTSDGALGDFIASTGSVTTETDQLAVIAYARAQALAGIETLNIPADTSSAVTVAQASPSPFATETITTQTQVEPTASNLPMVSASGSIINGTAGSTVPANMEVTLRIFDEAFNETTFTTTANADNTFVFENVPINPNWVYVATVEFDGARFGIQGDPNASSMTFPISIYEVTNDPSVITIIGEVLQINSASNTLEILHAFQYRNDSDMLFVSGENEEGQTTSIVVTLPVGAIIVRTDNDQRYIIPEDNAALVDTAGVFPGEQHFISVVYLLPYFGNATVDYPANYQFDGPIRFLISNPELQLSGELYEDLGEQVIGEINYHIYGSTLNLQAGDSIRYTIEGGGIPTTSTDTSVVTSNNLIPILGIFLIVVGAVGAILIYFNRNTVASSVSNEDRLIDGLVRQIAELDAQHDAGQINHDLYHQRRRQLKARLDELMDGSHSDEEES